MRGSQSEKIQASFSLNKERIGRHHPSIRAWVYVMLVGRHPLLLTSLLASANL